MEVNANAGEGQSAFEIAVVVQKRVAKEGDGGSYDCVEFLVRELTKAGLIVERVFGLQAEFLKLAAPLETLGRAAAELQLRKLTHIGMVLPFEWDEADAFVKEPDGSPFNWCERYECFHQILYGIVNSGKTDVTLRYDCKELHWKPGESLLRKLEQEGVVKEVFPLHDDKKRKKLLKSWALNIWDFTNQPVDEIHTYFGTKIATYFAFLGMYTRWILFPTILGLLLQFVDFGSMQLLALPTFFICIVSWAVLFLQFWKRKNAAILARWHVSYSAEVVPPSKTFEIEKTPAGLVRKWGHDVKKDKELFQREEWFGRMLRFRNDTIVIFCIICLQLPFELAYAHLYEAMSSDVMKFGLTACYLFAIQYFNRLGGTVSVNLIKKENNQNTECRADSLIYKVFGLYFMQSYIGLFYHVLLHRNFSTLRKVLIQRLIVSEVLDNLMENSIPYVKYNYKKHTARKKNKFGKESTNDKAQFMSRVEKEYLKPTYTASVGEELEDGLFDDFLELALQFGMVMMFACAFPPAFAFAALNNITEIRTDALKMLAMLRRPIPRASATIGAWMNIFQFLIVTSICTNCALLACLYDQEGKWKIEPGLAAILIMEHILLLIKFVFSRVVPEEPAWVIAHRMKNVSQAQDMCSKRLLRTISDGEKLSELKSRKME